MRGVGGESDHGLRVSRGCAKAGSLAFFALMTDGGMLGEIPDYKVKQTRVKRASGGPTGEGGRWARSCKSE